MTDAIQIYISMLREAGLYNKISQAYAGLDTSEAVGVMVSYLKTNIQPDLILV